MERLLLAQCPSIPLVLRKKHRDFFPGGLLTRSLSLLWKLYNQKVSNNEGAKDMKHLMIFLIVIMLIISFTTLAFAGWLIFHKPAFRGKVIDTETKEPIEGAVVVVVYEKHVYGPSGGYTSVIKVKETLTDRKGEFFFPSYTTGIHPFSREEEAGFIIYKPGYGNFPNFQVSPPTFVDWDKFFSEDYGTKKVARKRSKSATVTFGVVELPQLKTRKERLRAIPGGPTDFGSKELPLLYKAMNEENKRFGLGEVK